MFATYLLIGVEYNIKDLLMNFMFLSWFDKQPGIGHLWFITMIMACYIMFIILSRVQKEIKTYVWAIIFVIGIAACHIAEKLHLPAGYALLYLSIACYLFENADSFINMSDKISLKYYTPIFIATNTIVILLFLYEIEEKSQTLAYTLGCVCGILWMIFLFRTSKYIKNRKTFIFLSAISYEIYLTHHPLCRNIGGYSMKHITQDPYIGLLLIASITVLSAILLNKLSGRIVKINFPKLRLTK